MNVKGTQHRRPCCLIALAVVLLAGMVLSDPALAAKDKPNVLVIWGDDIGISNISAYSDGLMGYETPNIDRIAKEGVRFLHYYGEQSCTAGRAAFLLPDVFGTRGTATFVPLANRLNPTHCSVLVWEGECDGTSTALYLSAAVSGSNMLIFPTQGFQVLQHSN